MGKDHSYLPFEYKYSPFYVKSVFKTYPYYNYIHGVKDCSRGNTYHNQRFKRAAESRGLLLTHNSKYGWSHTAPADELLQFVLDNDLTDILINRNEATVFQIPGTGTHQIPTDSPTLVHS